MGMMDDVFNEAFNRVAFDPDLCPGVESVIYTPMIGTPRTIDVKVDRTPGQGQGGGKSVSNMMEVWIKNHATAGTLSINKRDTLTIAREPGETPAPRSISKVFGDSDAGTWHIQIQ
jgi:hypothetical protein